MDRSERKAAVSAYKGLKAVAGVYAIRCAATDEQWVGSAPDLSTIWTRRMFALRQGIETNRRFSPHGMLIGLKVSPSRSSKRSISSN